MARSSVLLPDMFEPVTSSSVPWRPDPDVVVDASVVGQQRMAERLGVEHGLASSTSVTIVGWHQSGLSRRIAASRASASRSATASNQPRTCEPASARQRSSAKTTWKSHSVSA